MRAVRRLAKDAIQRKRGHGVTLFKHAAVKFVPGTASQFKKPMDSRFRVNAIHEYQAQYYGRAEINARAWGCPDRRMYVRHEQLGRGHEAVGGGGQHAVVTRSSIKRHRAPLGGGARAAAGPHVAGPGRARPCRRALLSGPPARARQAGIPRGAPWHARVRQPLRARHGAPSRRAANRNEVRGGVEPP